MPVYVYRGTNRTGGAVSGEQSATNKAELMNVLRRQQIKVSKLSEKGKEFNLPTFKQGVNAKDLAVFTRQFSVMIDAGLPLVQCLEILAGQQENKTFENWRVNTAKSLALTPCLKVGKLNSLPFSESLLTLICWRLSRLISSALLLADCSPLTALPVRLVPR